jgi:hypothetical protein
LVYVKIKINNKRGIKKIKKNEIYKNNNLSKFNFDSCVYY